jgi:hypothetical protein
VGELRKILQDGISRGEFSKDIDVDMVIATVYGTKNFIVNSPQLTSKMLGFDIQNDKLLEERLKPRIEAYLKRLLKCYLLNEHDNTNK